MDDLATRQTAFRDELIAAGHLLPLGPAGIQGFSGDVEDIRDGLSRLVRAIGAGMGSRRVSFPPLLPEPLALATGYVASFPQLIGAVDVFAGDDRDHRRMLAELERGEDWSANLVPAGLMCVSATCHPLYASLADTVVDDAVYDLRGLCFRHEPSVDPFRGVTFSQHEIIAVGGRGHVDAQRERVVEDFRGLLTGLGLDVRVESANDPFFGRAGRLLSAGQRDSGAKVEFTVAAYGDDAPRTAVASVNSHDDHFAHAFGLRLADGSSARTACAGLGLERAALALLRTHGLDVRDWDAAIRERLGLS